MSNEISGGNFFGPVLQVGHVHGDITIQLPAEIPLALGGLPRASPTFTGRGTVLDDLLGMLGPSDSEKGVIQVSAVSGMGGVGKTELVLQAAHAAREKGWFPGGVLFVDLAGYDERLRVDPAAALDGFLRAMGVPAEHIPSELQGRERLYRSVLDAYAHSGRDVLVVIDNAFSSEQARPLLPGDSVTRTLVTSRHTLAELGARLLDLPTLGLEASVELLDRRIRLARGDGDTRVRDEPEDANEIARLCGGLPLAIEIVAALLSERPQRSLRTMVEDLEDEHTRLDEMRSEERAVQAAFELSYRNLPPDQARVFRLVSVNPGPDISTAAAASMVHLELRHCRRLLDALARAHLLDTPTADNRWAMHDLVRLYAAEQAHALAAADRQEAAVDRLVEYYSDTARSAAEHADPSRTAPSDTSFHDREDALSWFDAELPNLVGVVRRMGEDRPSVALEVHLSLVHYVQRRRRFTVLTDLGPVALEAARRLGNRHGEARVLTNMGLAQNEMGRYEECVRSCRAAAEMFMALGDRALAGRALNNLGLGLDNLGRYEEAAGVFRRAIGVFRELGDRRGEGAALTNLGSALLLAGRVEESLDARRDAVAALDQVPGRPDWQGMAMTLQNLGASLNALGRHTEALAVLRRALAISGELDDDFGRAQALNNIAISARGLDRHDEAVEAALQAASLYRDCGTAGHLISPLLTAGWSLRTLGRYRESVTAHREGLDCARRAGNLLPAGQHLEGVSASLRLLGEFHEAVRAQREAVSTYVEAGEPATARAAERELNRLVRATGGGRFRRLFRGR
ncbi:tetratricopeptide repeat protein [Allostreptomyces psammosilenae]|uniref:Tetratricopeptide (TPR) repeat protein n=1 Tax=Allostreptomyces psammosilenae TaxID=1892865 RepID=A0A852ZZ36_9ACTN|nr:tetratricopeptide repeat protein [Allostreptomyces psammosilenae]NYI03861.1 tetratricopeptide (TPR) repeat protein [Allostreptomyces psammosilenae]